MHKILITGANGFIGRNFIRRYANKLNNKNTLLFVHGKIDKEFEKVINKRSLEYRQINLLKKESLGKWKHFDLIIHLAANTNTSERNQSANNIGTKNLVGCVEMLDKNTHFIFTSTTAIYSGRKNCRIPITDREIPIPSNEYGRAKLKAENYLRNISSKKGFKLTILRFCTVYGKNTKKDGLFSIIKNDIKKGGLISRFDWPGLTSLVHVNDVADCVWLLSQKPPRLFHPETYVVYADSLSLSQISSEICKAKKIKFSKIKLPHLFWKLGSVSRPNITLFENLLPYPLYNMLWRFSLITDHALWCESNKLKKRLPNWNPRKFKEGVYDVIS